MKNILNEVPSAGINQIDNIKINGKDLGLAGDIYRKQKGRKNKKKFNINIDKEVENLLKAVSRLTLNYVKLTNLRNDDEDVNKKFSRKEISTNLFNKEQIKKFDYRELRSHIKSAIIIRVSNAYRQIDYTSGDELVNNSIKEIDKGLLNFINNKQNIESLLDLYIFYKILTLCDKDCFANKNLPEKINNQQLNNLNKEVRKNLKVDLFLAWKGSRKQNQDAVKLMKQKADSRGALASAERIGGDIQVGLDELLIKENCVITNNSNVDVSQLENIVARFYPYVKEKLKFNKDAKLNFISDPKNAKDPWGKTAYYNPNSMEITIFVDGRHPKDMLRSISHELVHHAQNCRGEFDKKQTVEPGYAQKDPHMRRMEGEAYLLGNGFLVRDFEDYLKSQRNQNLTENKKMKGLTNEQLKTVLENTISRVIKEAHISDINEGASPFSTHSDDHPDAMEESVFSGGGPLKEPVEEEVVEEELENPDKADLDDDGKISSYEKKRGKAIEKSMKSQKNESVKETFTSKKDQLLFERLTNKWAK